ncbi:VOC family protein, partial [Streptomyces sp. NPDC000188]
MALATLGVVVLDCPDPRALADFYAEVLGGTVTSDDGTWVDLEVPGGRPLAF